MGIITDKLNAEWKEKTINDKVFNVRAEIENLYVLINDIISIVSNSFPTGNETFDNYIDPIKDEIITFRDLLNIYSELINWRQP